MPAAWNIIVAYKVGSVAWREKRAGGRAVDTRPETRAGAMCLYAGVGRSQPTFRSLQGGLQVRLLESAV